METSMLPKNQRLVLEVVQKLCAFLYSTGVAATMRCQHCNSEVEDIQHLLLQCPWSIQAWDFLEFECGKQLDSLQSTVA